MVILGHTLTGCTVNSEETFLFNAIWALQMPLFMLISGFVTQYSATPCSVRDLLRFVLRKSVSYLFPWLVWTVFIRGFLFGQKNYLDIPWLVFHMDSGYWFLFSLWTITVVFGMSRFLSGKFHLSSGVKGIFVTGVFYSVGMLLLFGITQVFGESFLSLKQTLYYMLFYFAGFTWGEVKRMPIYEKLASLVDAVIGLSVAAFFFLLQRYNLYSISDNLFGILVRGIASLAGCIGFCGLIANCNVNGKACTALSWIGAHTLEIYLIHYLVLCCIQPNSSLSFLSVDGFLLTVLNFVITVILSVSFSALINQNRFLRKFLLGKR